MNLSPMLRQIEKLEARKHGSRMRVIMGPFGGDFEASINAVVAAGRARKTDLFVYVNRYADDWKPE